MKKHVKLFSVLLAVCLTFSLLAGCQRAEAPKDSAAPVTAENKSDPLAKYDPVKDKKYKISWLALTNAPIDPEGELIKHWENKFDVDLDVVGLDQKTFNEQLNLKLAAREVPDVMGLTGNLDELVKQGVVGELPDPALKKFIPKILAELEVEEPGLTKYGVIDSKRYGVPNSIFMYNKMRKPIVYNGLWLTKLGVQKTPETLEEFEKLMYRFTREDPDGNGKNDTYGLSKSGMDVVWGISGFDRKFWHMRDGKAVYGAVQPEMKNAISILNKWYKDGVLDPEFITGENTGGYWALSHAFINSRIGLTTMGSFYHWNAALPGRVSGQNYVEIEKKSPEMAKALTFGQPPKGSDGKGGVGRASLATNQFFTVGVQLDKEPDKLGKILQMIEYLCGTFDEDSYITYMHGLKGKQWERDAQGAVKAIGKFADITEIQKIGGWGIMNKFVLAKNQMLVEGALMEWGSKNGFEKGAYEPLYPGFVIFPSMTKYKTETDKIEDEAYIKMITGDKPVSYFDEFVKEWNRAGGEQITKEVNDWAASNKK